MAYDYSSLGGVRKSKYDYSSLGGKPKEIEKENIEDNSARENDRANTVLSAIQAIDRFTRPSAVKENLQDFAGGTLGTGQHIASSLLEGGEWATRKMAEKLLREQGYKDAVVPKWNAREFMGLEGDNQIDLRKMISADPNSLQSKIAGVLPLLGGAGATLGRTAAGMGAVSGLAADPNTKLLSANLPVVGEYMPEGRLASGVENALLTMLAPGVAKAIPKGIDLAKSAAGKVGSAAETAFDKLTPGFQANKLKNELNEAQLKYEQDVAAANEKAKSEEEFLKRQHEAKKNLAIKQHEEITGNVNQDIQDTAQQVRNEMAQGANTTQEAATDVADVIRSKHDPAEANAAIYFDHVLKQTDKAPGGGIIYKKPDPLISTALDESKPLLSTVEDMNIGDVYDEFKANPTFRNAHNLKQQLGTILGELRGRTMKTAAERLELNKLNGAYKKITEDMENYLVNRYPNKNEDLIKQWKTGNQIFENDVVPWRSNKKLREINVGSHVKADGKQTRVRKKYVKDIHQAFENIDAGDLVDLEGNVIPGPGTKIFNQLPQSTKNKILFLKGGAPKANNPDQLINIVDEAERTGFQNFASPSLKQGIEDILRKQSHLESFKGMHKAKLSDLEEGLQQELARVDAQKNAALKEAESNTSGFKETREKINELKSRSNTLRRAIMRKLGYGALGVGGYELLKGRV